MVINKDNTKKCLECGNEMPRFFLCGNHGGKREKKFCSRKCQLNHGNKRRYNDSAEVREKKRNYDKVYRKNNYDKRIKYFKRYYKDNREDQLLKSKQYCASHMEVHRKASKAYEKNHWGKILEVRSLRNQFRTAKLPVDVKKKWALIHLSNRLIRPGTSRLVDRSDYGVKKILNHIKKGETHEAYI